MVIDAAIKVNRVWLVGTRYKGGRHGGTEGRAAARSPLKLSHCPVPDPGRLEVTANNILKKFLRGSPFSEVTGFTLENVDTTAIIESCEAECICRFVPPHRI